MPEPVQPIKWNHKGAYTTEQVDKACQMVLTGSEPEQAAEANGINPVTFRAYIYNRPVPGYLRKLTEVLNQCRKSVTARPRKLSPNSSNHPSKRKL